MEHLRKGFDEQLQELQQEVVRMGSLAGQALGVAMRILVERAPALEREVFDCENQVDALNLDIERRGVQLLATQQPMARDLRTLAAVLKIISDLERIGDYSVDLARQAVELSARPLFKPLIDLPQMADIAQEMLRQVLAAFVARDIEAAVATIERDHEVDRLYRLLHTEIVEYLERDPKVAFQAVHLIMIGTYLERIADHITNVGERIWYMETGELKELHE
jgi:phosphate transport system protein